MPEVEILYVVKGKKLKDAVKYSKGYLCCRCGNVWNTNDGERPVCCSKCKSPYWDRKRKLKLEKKKNAKTNKI